MKNREANLETFKRAATAWNEKQAKHHGYNEWCGTYQDDLNEMFDEEWTFTKANQKVWDTYFDYFKNGTIPYGMKKLQKKEIERRLEEKMDKMIQVEFERYAKATY